MRRGYLSELAVSLLRAEGEREDVRTLLSAAGELLRKSVADAELDSEDRAELVLLLVSECRRIRGEGLTVGALLGAADTPPVRERTVYVRSTVADRAYLALSAPLHAPSVGYRESLRELLDDVENGYTEYAVLPLFSGGSPARSVLSRIEERGLFVLLAAEVPSPDDELHFALVSRTVRLFGEPDRLLLRYEPYGVEGVSAVAHAARRFGLFPLWEEITALPYGKGRCAARTLLRGDEESILQILVYLLLFSRDFAVYGCYTEIKTERELP